MPTKAKVKIKIQCQGHNHSFAIDVHDLKCLYTKYEYSG